MTVAELIAELQTKDPTTLVLIDREHHGNWYLDSPDELQDKWVAVRRGDFVTVNEGTEDAKKAVRLR